MSGKGKHENMYIVSYTKFVEITIYPWIDYDPNRSNRSNQINAIQSHLF